MRKLFNIQLIQKRFYKKQPVRVRFAPSPTGFLHLGGLRTALYNYLYARKYNGSFILRIEDTDQTRVVPGAMEQLHDDLLWAGIIPDEDPIRGGPSGPYIQSRRLEIYQENVKKLLDNGSAYHCFCTDRRLELIKREANRLGEMPKYDNRCRNLSKDKVKEKIDMEEAYCIRFKLSPTPSPFKDLVYGDITFDASTEGDPVIMKTDGYPTYHFANIVDDHYMRISHVLRGVEWQISTQKHLLLYKAFGWTPPHFGHLPLILNSDGSKLSKRQDNIRVEYYRQNGIFPVALINYITTTGGGFKREQGTQECYNYEDLINQFAVKKIKPNSSKLNPVKLQEFNQLELSSLLENEKNNRIFISSIVNMVQETFPERKQDGSLKLDDENILSTLKWAKNRITKLTDLVSSDLSFLWIIPPLTQISKDSKHIEMVQVLIEKLADSKDDNIEKDVILSFIRELSKNNGVSYPEFMKTLRSLLSGLKVGPGIADMMEILGKEKTIERLKRYTSDKL
ncbi:probable glutamate--tRNA ligase, mitochondrial isoform X2 [Leptopilina boulardi]|uniref:probable glutamate--tRNA ligase, mitochondrial isoform X2 n=1 Tax=Leptopilina boulardi TaxID=63433 RepID=UPI0021F63A9F|nr:probable glutamate--tRNA ligase, mitochondrial isoform X2 [Leptopilina boulardi]